MSFNPLKLIGLVDRGIGLVDQFVVDKDKKEELKHTFRMMQEEVYLAELSTKTVPWVDALHKMGRQAIAMVSIVGGFVLLYFQPDIDPMKLAAIVAPGGIYAWTKGKGDNS